MKKIISLLLACIITISFFPISAYVPSSTKQLPDKNIKQTNLNINFNIGNQTWLDQNPLNGFSGSFHIYTFDDGLPAYDIDIKSSGIDSIHKNETKLAYNNTNPQLDINTQVKSNISIALNYGYNGKVKYGTDTIQQHIDEYIATQISIWIMIANFYERAEREQLINLFTKDIPSQNNIKSIAQKILKQSKDHKTIPSFTDNNSAKAPVHNMTYNKDRKRYEVMLQDTNTIEGLDGTKHPLLKYFTSDKPGYEITTEQNNKDNSIIFAVDAKDNINSGNIAITFHRTSSEFLSKIETADTIDFWINRTDTNNNDKVSIRPGTTDFDVYYPGFVTIFRPTGTVKIQKTDKTDGAPLKGAGFSIYHRVDGTKLFDREYITDDKGEAIINNIPVSPAGTFYIKETTTPSGYEISNIEYDVAEIVAPPVGSPPGTSSPSNITIQITNTRLKGSISGTKIDSSTNKPLAGAIMGLYLAGSDLNSIPLKKSTTDINGTFKFTDVEQGNYVIKEIKAPDGFILTDKVINVTVDNNNLNIDIKNFTNDPKLYTVTGIKKDNTQSINLKGAVFGIFPDSNDPENNKSEPIDTAISGEDGKFHFYNKSEPIDTAISGEDGKFHFYNLKVGNYIVKEIKAPDGYELNKSYQRVYIKGDINTPNIIELRYPFLNKPILSNISGIKVNSITNQPLKGAVIGLFSNQNGQIGNLISEVTTSDNGRFEFTNLKFGSYIIKEIAAPDGYILTDQLFHVEINNQYQQLDLIIKNDEEGTVDPGGDTFDPPIDNNNNDNNINKSPQTNDKSNIELHYYMIKNDEEGTVDPGGDTFDPPIDNNNNDNNINKSPQTNDKSNIELHYYMITLTIFILAILYINRAKVKNRK